LNEIHPKLIKEAAGSDKISKGFLDNYMERQQRDAIQIRNAPPGQLESPDTSFVNRDLKNTQQQKLYHVRGAGEQRNRDIHYSRFFSPDEVNGMNITGKNAYAFDGVGDTKPLARYNLGFDEDISTEASNTIGKALDDLGIESTDNFASIFRVQSDFMNEVAGSNGFIDPKTQAAITKKLLQYNKLTDELNPFLATNPKKSSNANLIAKVLEDVYELPVPGLQFKLDPEDMQKFTGKSFIDSLDKTPEDIFYTMKDGKQTYIDVPNNPEALSKAYFEDITKGPAGFADLQNGVTILKKAVIPKVNDFGSGKFKIDPYFEKSTSNEMKLPVRANVLEAFKAGKKGIHIGPAQASMEVPIFLKNTLEAKKKYKKY